MSNDILSLRPYQTDALLSVVRSIANGNLRPAVVLPTGAGKTVIFAHLVRYWREANPTHRVLILVHRDELVRQTVRKIRSVAPHLTVGVVKAEENEIGADVIVGSVQTLRAFNRRAQITDVGLVIVDEAHHAAAESYKDVMSHFGCFTADVPAVGFSATLQRADKGDLSGIWSEPEADARKDILDLIPEFLCDVRGKLVTVDGLSLMDVHRSRGDFTVGSLTDALVSAEAQEYVVRGFLEHAADRPTMVFVPSVYATEIFMDAFAAAGVTVGRVWGTMPDEERRLVLKRYGEGDIQVVINCGVLTEGYDEPKTSCIIIARPTESAPLYVQMVGRGLRKFPGKTDCLVLDVVGVSQTHRLATLVDLTSRRVAEIMPGESLAEAAVREREAGNPNLASYVISTRDVDLFHRSPSVWLRTGGGVYFLTTRCQYTANCPDVGNRTPEACGSHIYFLWPDKDGMYKVGIRPTRKTGGKFVLEGLDLEYAMTWAEEIAFAEDSSLTDRQASWRRRNQEPRESQLLYARALRIDIPENISRRDLSDMISVRVASNLLDTAIRGK